MQGGCCREALTCGGGRVCEGGDHPSGTSASWAPARTQAPGAPSGGSHRGSRETAASAHQQVRGGEGRVGTRPLLPLACSVLYLTSVETESLTGPQAVARASSAALSCSPRPTPAVVHFKVSAQGITLTDNQRK